MEHLYRKVFFLFAPPSVLFIMFIFINVLPVKGQINLSFSSDTLYLQYNQTTLLKARIQNTTSSTQQYYLQLHSGSVQSILSLPDSLRLAPGESTIIPFLLLAPRRTAGGPHPFQLTVVSDSGMTSTARCILLLKETKKVYATLARREIYISPEEDSVHLPIALHNAGNTPNAIQFTIHDQRTGRPLLQISADLAPFTDTLLSVHLPISGALRQLAISTLLVTGRYLGGEVFSILQIQVFNTKSHKNYRSLTSLPSANSLGMYTHFIKGAFSYFEWIGKGAVPAGKNQLVYQLGALYYPSMATSSLVLRNTHIDYLTDHWQIQAGNVYQNEEIYLTGRGLSIQYTMPTNGKWELGYLNNSYNVIGSFRETPYNRGHSIFVRYAQPQKNKSAFSGLLIQQWDPFYKGNNTLGGSTVDLKLAPRQQLKLGAYSSYHAKGQHQKDPTGKWGGAVLTRYKGTAGQWQIQSLNYISSKDYAGSAKGAVDLRETIRFSPVQHSSLWVQYSKNSSHATFLYADSGFFNPFYSSEIEEVGFRRNMQPALFATLRLYHRDEQATFQTAIRQTQGHIRAFHLESTWNYTFPQGKGLYLQMDGGWSASGMTLPEAYFAWKAQIRYRMGAFSFHGNYQQGAYNSSELVFNESRKGKWGLLQAGPAFSGSLFKNKITLYANSNVTWEKAFQRWTLNNNINFKWHLPGHFEAELNYNRIRYLGFGPWTDLFDAGIIKKFNGPRPGKQHTLTLHLFEDQNGNYRPDFGEKPVAGQLVKLNKALFKTDVSGTIIYKNLPEGNYHVSLLRPNGLISRDTTVYLRHKTALYLPMHEMRSITGTIELHKLAYSYPIDGNVMGIYIVATDPVGNQFKTRSDARGRFFFSLPANNYTLQLKTESLPDKFTCPQPHLSISLVHHRKRTVHFDVYIRKRKTEVKQFFSPSLSSDH